MTPLSEEDSVKIVDPWLGMARVNPLDMGLAQQQEH